MLTFLALFACATETTREDDILALTGDTAAGATVYADNCASCHAADATGDFGPALAGWSEGGEEFLEYVINGDGDMPAFDTLEDQAIADVLAYVESL